MSDQPADPMTVADPAAERPPTVTSEPPCARCEKPRSICVCDLIQPLTTRTEILILQHPQEPDRLLGSARLAEFGLSRAKLKIGLSWPNLSKALGREVQAKEWGVLFLGSAKLHSAAPEEAPLVLVDRAGRPQRGAAPQIQGLVVLDGTWSQAKTIWWRNAWLLKLQRLVLNPAWRSRYGELRREPRPECLSTIEAIAFALGTLEPGFDALKFLVPFDEMLQRYRDWPERPAAERPSAGSRSEVEIRQARNRRTKAGQARARRRRGNRSRATRRLKGSPNDG